MSKVSVIIPLYNREEFIAPCLQSVINQTYQDMEVVVIDDGSTDRSPEICMEWSRTDSRIKLWRQKNSGVSAARNRGLELAEGEYVFFLDSDDKIHPLLLESSVRQMETRQAHIASCGHMRTEKDISSFPTDEPAHWQSTEGYESEAWFHTNRKAAAAIGGKMIRRDLIGSLRFDETLRNGEDTMFLYELMCQQPRIVFTTEKWYYYRIHPNSLTNSDSLASNIRYFECSRRIRDGEWRRGHAEFALIWEKITIMQMERSFLSLKKLGDREGCGQVKHLASAELRHPLYRRVRLYMRLSFMSCMFCPPLYEMKTLLRRAYYKCLNTIKPQKSPR
ncbi:glycosyltransferase family 2 protein [Oscillospiraceae bacterium 50-58]